MKIKRIKLIPNRDTPILLEDNGLPLLHVFIYSTVSHFRALRYNSQYAYLTIIAELYTSFRAMNVNLQEILTEGDFQHFFKNFEEAASSFIFTNEIKFQTKKGKLNCIKNYIIWSIDRFITKAYSNDITKLRKIKEQKVLQVEEYFNSFIFTSTAQYVEFKSLSAEQMEFIYATIDPHSPHNPFNINQRMRNYVMIKLLADSGLRIGELLNLTTKDFKEINSVCHLVVGNHQFQDIDDRRNKPQIKTKYSSRLVAISDDFNEEIIDYIENERRQRHLKMKHPFVFTANSNHPLSSSTIYFIFRILNNIGKEAFGINKWQNITPHCLRHTFAYSFMKYLVEERNMDLERAKDELRRICGWKNDSAIPIHYAKRYIWEIANKHNIERLKNYYDKND